jgi:hypothetical protein
MVRLDDEELAAEEVFVGGDGEVNGVFFSFDSSPVASWLGELGRVQRED